MSDNNGWAGKPGVPLNPKQDGAHVLRFPSGNQRTWIWRATPAPFWVTDTSRSVYPQDIVSFRAIYVGPCLTPAEVDARVSQAKREALEEVERHFKEAIAGTPLGHEDRQRGASTYNWLMYCISTISALKGEKE